MQALIDTIERITRLFGMIAAWLIVPLAGSMMWEVISRYVFSRPTIWAYEIAYMQMGALFVLGIALTTQAKAHVRVDLLYDIFSPRWKAVVDLVGFLLLAVMILWLCYGLWGYFEDGWISGERSGESIWNPVVWPARLSFFVGFILFALQILAEVLKSLRQLFHKEHEA
ncbi:TRAP transporter small permease subunit [Paracoccaceae bacterium]|nr:TRAP transporter small permease subunit [Paracoccaceae bacterium]